MFELKIMAAVILVLGLVWLAGMAVMRRQDESVVIRRSYTRDSQASDRSKS